jgi:hypothetical protein
MRSTRLVLLYIEQGRHVPWQCTGLFRPHWWLLDPHVVSLDP